MSEALLDFALFQVGLAAMGMSLGVGIASGLKAFDLVETWWSER